MTYADNPDKIRGIEREPVVAERILKYFKTQNMRVTMEKASLFEDRRKKYDYKYICDEKQSFAKTESLTEIKVDIKCGKSFTLVDSLGKNTLENSESTYIVFETYEGSPLLWVNTIKLKECLKRYPTDLRLSKRDTSKYFFIEPYINLYKKFFGNFAQYI